MRTLVGVCAAVTFSVSVHAQNTFVSLNPDIANMPKHGQEIGSIVKFGSNSTAESTKIGISVLNYTPDFAVLSYIQDKDGDCIVDQVHEVRYKRIDFRMHRESQYLDRRSMFQSDFRKLYPAPFVDSAPVQSIAGTVDNTSITQFQNVFDLYHKVKDTSLPCKWKLIM